MTRLELMAKALWEACQVRKWDRLSDTGRMLRISDMRKAVEALIASLPSNEPHGTDVYYVVRFMQNIITEHDRCSRTEGR